jgi:hypothetical protein
VILEDGSIWVYRPKSVKAKPFGKIENGHIKTAYSDLNDAYSPNFDVYTAGPGSSCGFWSTLWNDLKKVVP